ncbi:MAG: D-2-hydroxyacid dehydrogenase [Vicinamibacteria bacterium]|nr:D-2-hydroxyacid dehydrogenase [Vicinamibacteria bacterium]
MEQSTLLVVGKPGAPHLGPLSRLSHDATILIGIDGSLLAEAGPKAEVILCDLAYGRQLESLWSRMTAVRWIHSVAAGVDHLLFPALVESDVVLTNGRGAFKRSLAEFVMAGALHFAKDFPRLERQRSASSWQPYDMEELHGRTLGIVGLGEIGRATARLAQAFGMRVLAVRRHAEKSAGDSRIDEILPRERLADLMSRSDYVVVALPLTSETRGMIDASAIGAMKSTAVLINVGRGPVVVEKDLIAALSNRRIRGAALDVFDTEPLPAGHPFYGLDNVLLSPHTADHVAGWLENAVEIFLANFDRYRRGEPMTNVVDKRSGY